jgi:CHASE1-domain containing sensor protein
MNPILDGVMEIASDGIPSLFRSNLPEPVHRLRLAAWIFLAATAVLFILTEVPSLEADRRLLKGAALGGLAILVALLVAMTLMLKHRKGRS